MSISHNYHADLYCVSSWNSSLAEQQNWRQTVAWLCGLSSAVQKFCMLWMSWGAFASLNHHWGLNFWDQSESEMNEVSREGLACQGIRRKSLVMASLFEGTFEAWHSNRHSKSWWVEVTVELWKVFCESALGDSQQNVELSIREELLDYPSLTWQLLKSFPLVTSITAYVGQGRKSEHCLLHSKRFMYSGVQFLEFAQRRAHVGAIAPADEFEFWLAICTRWCKLLYCTAVVWTLPVQVRRKKTLEEASFWQDFLTPHLYRAIIISTN